MTADNFSGYQLYIMFVLFACPNKIFQTRSVAALVRWSWWLRGFGWAYYDLFPMGAFFAGNGYGMRGARAAQAKAFAPSRQTADFICATPCWFFWKDTATPCDYWAGEPGFLRRLWGCRLCGLCGKKGAWGLAPFFPPCTAGRRARLG